MNPTVSATPPAIDLHKADRVGVAASILCAIHCGVAPFLLLFLPSLGKIWAHPASHILVAIFVVPLAIFSIRKGYQTHRKRWILTAASIGIFFVLVGSALPAFAKTTDATNLPASEPASTIAVDDETLTEEFVCDGSTAESTCDMTTADGDADTEEAAVCVDNCCPSLQVDDTGKTSLHVPPAAIVTTLGGIFLITAHVGNLCACGHACRSGGCADCA